jgi:D-aminoacyl-tRNA deacylase
MARHMAVSNGLDEVTEGPMKYRGEGIVVYGLGEPALYTNAPDLFVCEAIVFLSKHASQAGVASFTTHSLGNWGDEAKLGGKPKELSTATPLLMLQVLRGMAAKGAEVEKTYEATHHGPLMRTPCLFAELGGNERITGNEEALGEVADAVFAAATQFLDGEPEHEKVVIGIGGTHYPGKFTRLALDKGYAFSHIMPKHAITNADGTDNLGMLSQALERSSVRPEAAVLDWKSLNSSAKAETLKKLNELGLDYEKV